MKRRTFGLVFEHHQPEAVELPRRPIRRGDKVRVLPPRGEVKQGDQRLWRVERIERVDGTRVAHIFELDAEDPQTKVAIADDLVVVAEFNDRIYPGLIETGRVERGGPSKPFHTVINAENYHSLEMLTYTHRGKVDAIYIDPPYNTGARDWKYNNNYVASDDDYRHSKWLAFMERRLNAARELLNPQDSVLVVTIDEKEVHRLGLLLEQSFPEARVQMISSVINPTGAIRANEFTRTNEFVFVVLLGAASIHPEEFGTKDGEVVRWNSLRRFEMPSRRGGPQPGPDQFYPVYVERETHRIAGVGDPLPLGTPRSTAPERAGCATVFPLKPDGTEMTWGLTGPTLLRRVAEGYARATPGRDGGYTLYYLTSGKLDDIATGEIVVTGKAPDGSAIVERPGGVKTTMPTTHWERESHNAQSFGTKLITRFIGTRRFPFPKSLYAVEDVLRMFIATKPDAIVLDFFSGSGTTAHAVMRLNRQDGGRRQCISVTNNEVSADEQRGLRKQGLRPGDDDWESQGICDYITKPRVTAAITGTSPSGAPVKGDYKFADEFPMSQGFEENALFLTLTYEAPLSVRHNRAFERIAPMLWMRAGSIGRIISDLGEDGWDVTETYGVVQNLDQAGNFVARVAELESVRTAFVVTDDDSAFQMVCRDLPSQVLPVRLYESYLQNFILGGGR
ncbi:DNA methyltransferase [Brachybacterium sp. AOP42-E1-35]|uniref:DNA methyltransferase n=1 Tax=Brachybacterium sp. AOP42-E1-35 TaxID=3457664 RepID=UPI00402A7651